MLLCSTRAGAAELDAAGNFVFADNAYLTLGFESLADAKTADGAWLVWGPPVSSRSVLTSSALTQTDWDAATVTPPVALEGQRALKLGSAQNPAFAILDKTLFKTFAKKKIQITFWGYSVGAEPQLDVVYPSNNQPVGPNGFGHIVAIRTGRETSDGWAEYSTGPIDGAFWATQTIAAIILTARYPTAAGYAALDSFSLAPSGSDTILDATAYALADAVEIAPASGTPLPPSNCTAPTAATDCGDLGECAYGHCLDGSIIWGPLPAPDHRADLANRWAFIARRLSADRLAATTAATLFSDAAVANLATATTAAAFYGGLHTLVTSLRDAHTSLGVSPSNGTVFYESLSSFNQYSELLDLCFGLATDDLSGNASTDPVYAIFWIALDSMVGHGLGGTLIPGDVLTQIDGQPPDAWLDAVGPRFRDSLPNDPAAEPASRAVLLSGMLAKYASTAVFSSCTAPGVCNDKTVAISDMTYDRLTNGSFGNAGYSTQLCSGRFTNAVSTWGPSNDEASYDEPVSESQNGYTAVEFDGFDGAYDSSDPNYSYPSWDSPTFSTPNFGAALHSGQNLLVDARLGHGGLFALGHYLAHQIRGTQDPYFTFAVPRGAWDDIDPMWLFDPGISTCTLANASEPDICGWTGGNIDDAQLGSPPAGNVKIAWINGNDVSMNDIVPRDLLGSPDLRIFGPHPTSGAYGEVSRLPPIVGAYRPGSIQVLDMRFGTSFNNAVNAPWGSGKGVPPDQVVLQKVSDILTGQDTVLAAAKAWLNP